MACGLLCYGGASRPNGDSARMLVLFVSREVERPPAGKQTCDGACVSAGPLTFRTAKRKLAGVWDEWARPIGTEAVCGLLCGRCCGGVSVPDLSALPALGDRSRRASDHRIGEAGCDLSLTIILFCLAGIREGVRLLAPVELARRTLPDDVSLHW